MKGERMPGRFYVECSCASSDHLLVFDSYDAGDEPEWPVMVEVFFTGNYKAPWYKRIWYAVQFIFDRKKFCWGDSVCIDKRNVDQLEALVNHFKKENLTEEEAKKETIKKLLREAGINLDGDDWDVHESNLLDTIIKLSDKLRKAKKPKKIKKTKK